MSILATLVPSRFLYYTDIIKSKEGTREFDTSFFSVLIQSLYLSHLWLIFLSNFVNFIVLLCTLCGIIEKTDFL